MGKTEIGWTDYSLNPGIYGCEVVSPACTNCYAASMAKRLGSMGQASYAGLTRDRKGAPATWTGEVRVDFDAIGPAFAKLPKKKPFRAFVTSMADLFHPSIPDFFIVRVFDEMRMRPHGTFQVLTKRIERVAPWWPLAGLAEWPANVWMGTTVEDQRRADERVPALLRVPARVRFLSVEPMLGPVDLRGLSWRFGYYDALTGTDVELPTGRIDSTDGPRISWVIAGCESGPNRRSTDRAWVRSLRDQCAAAGVPFFLKQLTDGADAVESAPMLDGRRHLAFPATP